MQEWFEDASSIKIQPKRVGLVQSRPHYHLMKNLLVLAMV